jgi:hypothetical protein
VFWLPSAEWISRCSDRPESLRSSSCLRLLPDVSRHVELPMGCACAGAHGCPHELAS